MELTRKLLIISGVIGVEFVAFTLRMWVLGDRSNSLKDEFRSSLIALLVFAVIAAFIIYINN
jgi:hypothetical protein